LAHAYLFHGPNGTGKKLAALQFAKALYCLSKSTDACDTCVACRKIVAGNHPDVMLISPDGTSIRIDHMRTVQRQLGYKPYEGRRTTVIIDGCELLTPPATNALLKTLEEPPASALLVLLTGKKDALPLTVLSRCQLVPFRPLAPAHICTILEQQGMQHATASLAATLAEGRLDTFTPGNVAQVLARRQEAYTLLQEVTPNHEAAHAHQVAPIQGPSVFMQARQLAGKRVQCEELLHWLSLFYRDLVILKVASTAPLYNHDLRAELIPVASRFPVELLLDAFALIEQLRHYLTMNVNPQLIFERLIIHLQQAFATSSQQHRPS
jgi:DNA polymerase-3 subunit delta'